MSVRITSIAAAIALVTTLLFAALASRIGELRGWSEVAGWLVAWSCLCAAVALVVAHLVREPHGGGPDRDGSIEVAAQRLMRQRALAHPSTAVPLMVAATTFGYIIAIAPDGESSGHLVLLAMGAAATAAIGYGRARRGAPRLLPDVMSELALAQAHESARERGERIESLRTRLGERLESAEAAPGAAETFAALEREHRALIDALAERRESDPLSVAVLPALADETYRRGLGLLAGADDLASALRAAGELTGASTDQPGTARSAGDGREDRVGRLQREAQRCVATLALARVDLIALRTEAPEVSSDHALTAMQQAIRQARVVQDEIDALGSARSETHA